MSDQEDDVKLKLSSSLKTAELRKDVETIMRYGASLVRDSNSLPKITGGQFKIYNSYPTFNGFMKKQEERINALMNQLTKSIGCAMRVPNVGSSSQEYTECVIEAQDNIAERAATLLEVLKKAERDEIVQVPEFILKAAPTNKKTENEVSAAMRTFSSNIGTILAQKFKERKEEAAQMVVHEKPQKTYNLVVDNSIQPFARKLKIKHNEIEKKKGIIVIDEDDSGKLNWAGNSEETEEEHPYIAEILNFKVPAKQLELIPPKKFKPLAAVKCTMVNTTEKLKMLRDILNSVSEFSVDLEHNDTRSYLGLTCLIQISTRDEDFIVDPFPIWEDVGILNEPFTNPNIVKVFHGSDNDVLWLQRDFGIHLINLFDTYVAMKKLKFPKFSLAYLVSKYANVALDKQYQLADWRIRPLRETMINYAREDTHYLLYCYDLLRNEVFKEFKEHGKKELEDIYTECKELCVKVYKKPIFNPKGYMTDIKFRFTLNSRQEYALTHLYKWRDQIGRNEDESPQFVLPNHMLLLLSETLPRDVGGIYACCNPLPYYVKQRTGDIFKIIMEAREIKLEKSEPKPKEVEDKHESKGVMNYTMDILTSILRSKIDFTYTKFDEERGEIEINKQEENENVLKKSEEFTLLNVLRPPSYDKLHKNITFVEENEKKNEKKVELVVKKLEEWVTPFECYSIVMKEKEKKAAEEEEKRKSEEDKNKEKKFSHNDPTVCRKPIFDDNIKNMSDLKLIANQNESGSDNDDKKETETEKKDDEPLVFDDSRFSEDQLMSKKALKRKRKEVRRNVDISCVLGEDKSSSSEVPINREVEEKKSKKSDVVEEFNYDEEDTELFDKPVKDNNLDFDPFHQKLRIKNKSKKQMMRKSANRQGTINYKK